MRQFIQARACTRLLLPLLLAGLAGCAVGPDFQRPDAPKATAYEPHPRPMTGHAAQHIVEGMDIPGQWWTLFHDKQLDALIADALAHNSDVTAAHAALRQAWENVRAQRGAYFPTVNGSVNSTRQDTAADVASGAASNASLYNLTTAQLSVSYSPDIWGGTRRQVESSVAQAEAQRFQLEATYLTLTSNVVNAAIGEASLREQIDVTQRIIDAQGRILETLRRQRALGDVSDGDIAVQVAALEQSRATLPPLEKQLAQQRDLLAVLTGRRPDEPVPAVFTLESLHLPKELPLSLPAKLVEQRPDVRAAEEALHGASADVGVAVAARLPDLQITATAGTTAEKTSQLFAGSTGFWSLGAGLTQPLFDGGALKHKQRAAEAAYDQAAAQYRGVVLAALQSVADTLHAIRADTQALLAAQRAERAAASSLSILQQQLSLGDTSQSQVLASELLWRQALLSLAQAKATRLSDTTALFQALGGGWWNRHDDADTASATTEQPHG